MANKSKVKEDLRTERFTALMTRKEREMLAKLAHKMRRTESSTVREAVRIAWESLEEME